MSFRSMGQSLTYIHQMMKWSGMNLWSNGLKKIKRTIWVKCIVVEILKYEHIEGFHSHNYVLCGGVVVANAKNKVEDVVVRETTKGKVDNKKNGILI